ncbi:uncharacterized protein [Argopecten irradians]|uniref:uncharacterized protein n=1 Tax=Argopecten irradians TaxID=31199 RepID=UPI003723D259
MTGGVLSRSCIFLLFTALIRRTIAVVDNTTTTTTTTTTTEAASICPTFPVKQENRELIFNLHPYLCELKVSVRVNIRSLRYYHTQGFMQGRGLRRIRNLHATEVKLVPTQTVSPGNTTTTEGPPACPNYKIRNISLLTVIDTIRNICQLVAGVQRINTQNANRRDAYDYMPVFYYIEGSDVF